MLKVSFISDTPMQSLLPLVNRCISSALIKVMPFLDQSFFQMIDVTDPATVDTLLPNAPNCIINWIEVQAVWWPVLWTD